MKNPLIRNKFLISMPSFLIRFSIVVVILVIPLFDSGCKNDGGPTGPANCASAGTLAFQSDKGDFLASGRFDTAATSCSGAGGFRSSDSKRIAGSAFRFNNVSDVDVITMFIADTPAVQAKSYGFTGSEESLSFHYFTHLNPHSSSSLGYPYLLTSGSIVVTHITQDSIRGTFSW